jgi:hypothetical protein
VSDIARILVQYVMAMSHRMLLTWATMMFFQRIRLLLIPRLDIFGLVRRDLLTKQGIRWLLSGGWIGRIAVSKWNKLLGRLYSPEGKN